jgi:hypothetical protein
VRLLGIARPLGRLWTSLSGASTICTACGRRTLPAARSEPVEDRQAHPLRRRVRLAPQNLGSPGLALSDGVEVVGMDAAAVSYPGFERDLRMLLEGD